MTVKQLIEELSEFPSNMEVIINLKSTCECYDETDIEGLRWQRDKCSIEIRTIAESC